MKFMITWKTRPELLRSAVRRFMQGGGPVPPGVTNLGRWHKADMSGGFHLVEAAQIGPILQHVAEWSDLLECEVVPVLEDAESAAVYASLMDRG
jgi:hypothetical protein